jgi:hypothetical protein
MWPVLGVSVWLGILHAMYRRDTLKLTGRLTDPTLAGAVAVAYPERRLRAEASVPLRRLLPQVAEEHAALWDAEQKAAVVKLLDDRDRDLVRGALHAVSAFAGAEALAPVERLARSGPPELREPAEAALCAVRRRAEEQKDRETLLRASAPADSSPDTLLRPAAALSDPAPEQLLRGTSDGPPEE